jgi:predicted ATP-grasp superfamily ATP-dependent carboligase
MRLLVVGLNSRPVAVAAKKLGFEVSVVDFFGDTDLIRAVDGVYSTGTNSDPFDEYSSKGLVEKAEGVIKETRPDALLLTSDVGCNWRYVRDLGNLSRVLGNDWRGVRCVRNWEKFFNRLDEINIPHPKTFLVDDEKKIQTALDEIPFPLITKPTYGSGGSGVRLVDSEGGVLSELKKRGEILVQEYIKGLNASVSVLSTGEVERAISLNEQIIGFKEFNVDEPFGYCGNIVPLQHELRSESFDISERICSEFGLVGTNGIDLVLADEPYVIEVNPRFQDTQECIERVYNINMVDLHIRALDGILPDLRRGKSVWAKAIFYADRDYKVGSLTGLDGVVDIPESGSAIPMGNPVCSVFANGKTRDTTFYILLKKLQGVKRKLK